ncbi:hypothetical protein HY483_02670 [Candidatus Woesearchaeota archaeon]|nr:hypothetical protein [Candidatus Woesearchaeota archaeon]
MRKIIAILVILLTIQIISGVEITAEKPLVIQNEEFKETITGFGSASLEEGALKEFTITGTYTKEADEKYLIGPYSIKGKSKKDDIKITSEGAKIKKNEKKYVIEGKARVFKRNNNYESYAIIGSSNNTKETEATLRWENNVLIITNSTRDSKSANAYYTINGTNPKIITTNTLIIIEKDNAGEYEKIYDQEEGKAIIEENNIVTENNNNNAYFTGIKILNGTKIVKNYKITPLQKATIGAEKITITRTKTGIDISNDRKTIKYYYNKKEYDTIKNEAIKKSRYYQCQKN